MRDGRLGKRRDGGIYEARAAPRMGIGDDEAGLHGWPTEGEKEGDRDGSLWGRRSRYRAGRGRGGTGNEKKGASIIHGGQQSQTGWGYLYLMGRMGIGWRRWSVFLG